MIKGILKKKLVMPPNTQFVYLVQLDAKIAKRLIFR